MKIVALYPGNANDKEQLVVGEEKLMKMSREEKIAGGMVDESGKSHERQRTTRIAQMDEMEIETVIQRIKRIMDIRNVLS